MLGGKQKMLLHVYKNAADLQDANYRALLREYASVSSAADRRFPQSGFDRCMAALEALLFRRVSEGRVENPVGQNRYIASESYWRNKLPRDGLINSRQRHTIDERWTQLRGYLPVDKRGANYLARIIRRCIGRPAAVHELTHDEALHVLDALADRLAYAIKDTRKTEEEGVPF